MSAIEPPDDPAVTGPQDPIVIGRVSTVYGVKGWVKLHSYTEPMTNLLDYSSVFVKREGQWRPMTIADARLHGKTLVAALAGIEDREQARALVGAEIAISRAELPELPEDEFYWFQLEGLRVVTKAGGESRLLGEVDHLMATGANDVLVVRPCEGSLDGRERLIPYVPEQFVTKVDLAAGEISVDWDPAF